MFMSSNTLIGRPKQFDATSYWRAAGLSNLVGQVSQKAQDSGLGGVVLSNTYTMLGGIST